MTPNDIDLVTIVISPGFLSLLPTRLDGSNTIGSDMDGDGLPDVPLRYEMDEGSVVEFPLNFCPGECDGVTGPPC